MSDAEQNAVRNADQIRAYFADRDVPCPGCGYNLRGVTERVCPACGDECSIKDFGPFRYWRRFSFAWVVPPLIMHIGIVSYSTCFIGLVHDTPPPARYSVVADIAMLFGIGAIPAALTIMVWFRRWPKAYRRPAGAFTLVLGLLLPLVLFALFVL